MSKRPYTDFDLPTKHLSFGNHWVPPKTRDPEEKKRRHDLPKEVLLTEFQQNGIRIASLMLGMLQDPHDIESANSFIAPSGLNTSWYGFGRGADVMRRRLKLAKLITPDPEQRPTSYMLHHLATDLFAQANAMASSLIVATQKGFETIDQYKARLARTVGHASLVLDSVPVGDSVGHGDIQATDFELQDLSRHRALKTLEQARVLHLQTGEIPSIAAFADADSGIARHLRRNATDAVSEAYEEAYDIAA